MMSNFDVSFSVTNVSRITFWASTVDSFNRLDCGKLFFYISPASFHLFSSFQTHTTIFITNKCEKMFIQYMVLGFKLTTFGT